MEIPYAEDGRNKHHKVRDAIKNSGGKYVLLVVEAGSRYLWVPDLLSGVALKDSNEKTRKEVGHVDPDEDLNTLELSTMVEHKDANEL